MRAPLHQPASKDALPASHLVASIVVSILVLVLSVRGWGSFQVGTFQDDAVYVNLARSIAFGELYGTINEPGPPVPAKYPFVFPLLLAPVVRLFPHEPLAATTVPLLATVLSLVLLVCGWPLLSPNTSRWWGIGVACLFGLSPHVIGMTRIAMSEPVFTAFVLAALLLTEALARRMTASPWLSVVLGIVLMLALFTRWVGAALWMAVLLRIGLARRDVLVRLAAIVAGSGTALALVLVLTPVDLSQLSPASYVAEWEQPAAVSGRVATIQGVAAEYATETMRAALVPVGGGDRERMLAERLGVGALPALIGASITVLVGMGVWRALRLRALSPSVMLFALCYSGLLLLWPWATVRFLHPLYPFLALQLLLGVATLGALADRVWRPGSRRLSALAVLSVWAALVAGSVWKSSKVEDSRRFAGDLRIGASWLAAHSPADAIVMTPHARAVYLYADRKTVELPSIGSAAELDRVLHDRRIDYFLLRPELRWSANGLRSYDDHTREILLPALAELVSQGRLTPVYESPPADLVRVYRVPWDGQAGPRRRGVSVNR